MEVLSIKKADGMEVGKFEVPAIGKPVSSILGVLQLKGHLGWLQRAGFDLTVEDVVKAGDSIVFVPSPPAALSLALLEPADGGQAVNLAGGPFGSGRLDMSYESLVLLENVKCTAPPTIVNRLTRHVFKKEAKSLSTDCVEELCTICQVEYKGKDSYMLLPCLHTFHDICGSEWFLNHSKLCPVCKRDVTEV